MGGGGEVVEDERGDYSIANKMLFGINAKVKHGAAFLLRF